MALPRQPPPLPAPRTVSFYNPAYVNNEGPLKKENRDDIPSSSVSSRHTDEISSVFYETDDPAWVQYGQKLMKLILMITLLLIVSTTASMSVLCFQLAIKGLTVANRSIHINNTNLGHLQQYCTLKSYITDDGQIQQGPLDIILPPETQLDLTLNYNTNSSVPWLWALMFMMMGPEVLGFLYSIKSWYSSKEPNQHRLGPLNHLAIIGTIEGLQVLATGLLAYYILPNFCGVTNVMLLNCTAIVPSIIKFISNAKRLKQLRPILTAFFIVMGQCLCPLCTFGPWESRLSATVLAPWVTVCLILVSITYWTNFIPSGAHLPAKVSLIFKAYRRNTRNPAVQLVLCSSKIAWIFGVMIIGTLTLGNVATVADLFRFSAWSGSNLNIKGLGTVNGKVNATCNSKFNQNFTIGNCYQQCHSTCLSFMEPCTEEDKDCLLYCLDACQPCHRTRPPSTTTEATVKSSAKPYTALLIEQGQVSSGHTSTSFYQSTFSTPFPSSPITSSASSHRARSRPTSGPSITVNITCNSETLKSKLCHQSCITTNETSVDSNMILNFDCQVYNPPTAGNDVISGVWLTLLMQIGCSWFCYAAAVLGCKVGIQQAAFALPLVLFVPLISVLCTAYFTFLGNQFFTFDFFPTLLFKVDNNMVESPSSAMYAVSIVAMIFWYMSFVALTLYTWSPTEERLAKVWKLFTQPSFWSFAIDKALLLSRRQFAYKDRIVPPAGAYNELIVPPAHQIDIESSKIRSPSDPNLVPLDDEKEQIHPKIYVCGTLWHEEREEMKSLLTSVLRLNHDQNLRQLVHNPKFREEYSEILKDIDDKDYYEVEFDLVFDDGFLPYKEEENPKGKVLTMNTYVRKWCEVVAETLTEVYGWEDKGVKPKKYHTPYGGRLVWRLQGGNILNVHLKNKQEIRHKKRWSQVMYMYYALDFLIKQDFEDTNDERKRQLQLQLLRKRLHNTYLLTLDGDVDFHPIAVTRLIDLMKKNDHVGSVCGRIHPLGSGPMIWYQMFEYAVGHWFQKAAEHVFGCVLCSPGCFALFRGTAVEQAMGTYSTVSENAMDFLQKDQGEDRWLCTLLLQNGWRIEYCAASDAKTYAPEELNVFFGQRKRWTPSTLANQMDLLNSYGEVIEKNASMTMSFMAYQLFMMVCTVIGTGSIFLMLFGSLSTIFLINDVLSLFINLVVVVIYSLVCYYCTEKVQLQVTQFLSLVYGLLMIAVLVAICIQGVEEGPSSPNTLFLIIMVACFLVGGLAHPQEFLCLAPGILYFAAIPCTYMLLNIYTVCNCHKVNWGTREAPNADAKYEQLKTQEQPAKSKIESAYIKYISYIGTFFATICCRQDQKRMDQHRIKMLEDQLAILTLKTDQIINGRNIEKKIDEQRPATTAPASPQQHNLSSPILKNERNEKNELTFARNKYRCDNLSPNEEKFWTGFVQTKLFALIEDKNKKKVKEEQLLELRGKSMTFFYLLNAFYVLIIFLLQLYTDLLSFNWPFTPCTWNYDNNPNLVKECSLDQALHYKGQCCKYCSNFTAPYYPIEANSTLDDCKNDYLEKQLCGCLKIEPVTIVVIVFFLSLLIVQFIGLIFHRIETGMVVVATTPFMEQNTGKVTLPDLLAAMQILGEMSDYEEEDDRQTNISKGLPRGNSAYIKRRSTINLNGNLPTIQEGETESKYVGSALFQRSSEAQKEFQRDEARRKQLTGRTGSQSQYLQFRQKIKRQDLKDNINKQSNSSADIGLKRLPSIRTSISYIKENSDEDDDVFITEVVNAYFENKYVPKKIRRGTIDALNVLVEDKRERAKSNLKEQVF